MPSKEEQNDLYASAIARGRMDLASQMEARGYKPGFAVLAKGLHAAAAAVVPAGVEKALSYWNENSDGSKEFVQFYSRPYWSNSSGGSHWVMSGESAWLALFESGKAPGDKDFDACAKLLSQADYGLGSSMDSSRDKDNGWSMLDQCAVRGWLSLATETSMERGWAVRPNYGKTTPLEMALMAGRGDFAAWLVSKGAKGDKESAERGARGAVAPYRVEEGASSPASWEGQVLGLRVGAKLAGLDGVVGSGWEKTMAEPLQNPGRLMGWLMVSGARAQYKAQAAAGPRELSSQIEMRSRVLSKARGEDWEALGKACENAGLLSFFGKKARAEAVKLRGQIQKEARLALEQIDAQQPPLGEALAHVDAGNLSLAAKAFTEIPSASRLSTCVSMLGLAKAGYWDMPMPQPDGESLQDRHPLRWAGFKLALIACGRGLDGPIPGLSGTTLAGLCSVLGFEDALCELIDAGARLDPDEMSQGPSPLELALRNGRSRFAQVLIDAGASPMEGVKESLFGYPAKQWAIHMAFDARDEALIESMLRSDPRCASLPDAKGQTLLQKAIGLEGAGGDGKDFGAKIAALAERSMIDGSAKEAPGAMRSKSL